MKYRSFILVVLIMSVVLAAPLTAQPEAVAIIGWPYSRQTILSPNDVSPTDFIHLICDGLTGTNSIPGTEGPLLATNWDVSEDGTVYTFNLREGVLFHDESGLDPSDVVYSFSVPGEESTYRNPNIAAIEVIDDYTIQFYLASPKPTFIAEVAATMIVPDGAWDDPNFSNQPICTGEYRVSEWEPDARLVIVANPFFWGAMPEHGGITPEYESLTFLIQPDTMTRQEAYDTGVLDVALIRYDEFDTLAGWNDGNLHVTDDNLTQTLIFNLNGVATYDLRFRQAVSYAIDRNEIANYFFGDFRNYEDAGKLDAARGYYPPNLMGGENQSIEDSRDYANQLLDEAGFFDVNGDGWREDQQGQELTLNLTTSSNEDVITVAQIVRDNLAQVGVQAEVIVDPNYEWLSGCDTDIASLRWILPYTDLDGGMRGLFNVLSACGYTGEQTQEIIYYLDQAAYLDADQAAVINTAVFAPLVYGGMGLYAQPEFALPTGSWWYCYFCRWFC